MKFAVLMIHRGDRPLFLEQFHRMLKRQTLQPDIVEIVDYPPKSDKVDITERYRYGYEKIKGLASCVVIMEVDDWYRKDYLEVMTSQWENHGRPDMFGTNYTIYYHLSIGKSITLKHSRRSSMMSTLIKADLDLEWPVDDYAYTDMYLWMKCKNAVTFTPKTGHICLGLKHGIGMTGGQFHTDKLKMFKEGGMDFKKTVGEEDYEFYTKNFPLREIGADFKFVE